MYDPDSSTKAPAFVEHARNKNEIDAAFNRIKQNVLKTTNHKDFTLVDESAIKIATIIYLEWQKDKTTDCSKRVKDFFLCSLSSEFSAYCLGLVLGLIANEK